MDRKVLLERQFNLSGLLLGWAVRLLAAAMVLSIAAEAYRSSMQISKMFALPAVLGFALAIETLWTQGVLFRRFKYFIDSRGALVALFLLPLAAQLLLIFTLRSVPQSDYWDYWFQGRHLWDAGEYVCPRPGVALAVAYKTPGMAAYLAGIYGLFGNNVLGAQLSNTLLLLGGNIVFYVLVRRRLDRQHALYAAALFVFWPSRSFSAPLLGYDPLITFILLLFWYLAESSSRTRPTAMLLVGVLGGVATLIRPPALLIVMAFVLYRLLVDGQLKNVIKDTVFVFVGVSLIAGPWVYRNHQVLGVAVLSTQPGQGIYRGFHPQAGRYFTNIGYQELLEEAGGDEVLMNELGWRHGQQFILQDPWAAARRVLRKWFTLLESDHDLAGLVFDSVDSSLKRSTIQRLRNLACGLCDVWYAWLSLCALVASWQATRAVRENPVLAWPILAMLSALAVYGAFEALTRYMVMYQCFWSFVVAVMFQYRMRPSDVNVPT